jgi:hypothetical protein
VLIFCSTFLSNYSLLTSQFPFWVWSLISDQQLVAIDQWLQMINLHWLSNTNPCPLTTEQWIIINDQWSTINWSLMATEYLSMTSSRWSLNNDQWSMINDNNHWPLINYVCPFSIEQWSLNNDSCSLITEQRSIISGQWSMTSDQWSMITDHWSMINDY